MADLKRTVAIEFETNASKATAESKKLAKAQDEVARSTDKAAKSTKKAWTALDTHNARMKNAAENSKKLAAAQREAAQAAIQKTENLKAAATTAAGYAAAIYGAAKAADAFSQRAMALDGVQRNLPFSIEKARKASQGLVDTYTLQQKAVQANTLGAAKNAEEYEKLVKVATTLARAQGIDATKGVEDLTTALARGSFQIADNLGISITAAEAQRRYAEHLGVTVDQLTEVQRAESKRFGILQKGIEAAENMTSAEDTLGTKIAKTKVQLIDGADAAIKLVDSIGQLGDAFDESNARYVANEQQISSLKVAYKALTTNIVDAAVAVQKLNNLINPERLKATAKLGGLEDLRHNRNIKEAEKATKAHLELTQAIGEAERQRKEIEREQELDQNAYLAQSRNNGGRRGGTEEAPIEFYSETESRAITEELRGQSGMGQDFSEEEKNARARFEWERDHQEKLNEMLRRKQEERNKMEKQAAKERLKIIKEEERRKAQALRDGFSAFQQVGNNTIQLSHSVAAATGASSERQARIVNKIEGVITVAKGVAAIAQGAIEVASQNYGKGIPMIIAGTAATITGGAMIANPLNPPGAEGTGGGGANNGAMFAAGPQREGPGSTNVPQGPISRPGLPGSPATGSPPQQGGQNTSPSTGQRTNVVNIENFNTLGTTNDEVATNIKQMLDDRERRVGSA